MDKNRFNGQILLYLVNKYSSKHDNKDKFQNVKLIFKENGKVTIGYRKGHYMGIEYVVAMDGWGIERPDYPKESRDAYEYTEEQITIDEIIYDKAKYYEKIYDEYFKCIEKFAKIYNDCIEHHKECNSIYSDYLDVEFKPITFKSEEHKVRADMAFKNLNTETKNIKNKYKITHINNKLCDFLDRYIK